MNAFPKLVVDAMADGTMRLHHLLWHRTRDSWTPLSPQQKKGLQRPRLDTAPPLPSLGQTNPATKNRAVELDNKSGEDFLYMHRPMIAEVNHLLAQAGDPQHPHVQGWETIPTPDNPDFPVPPAYRLPGDPDGTQSLHDVKSPAAYDQIHTAEKTSTSHCSPDTGSVAMNLPDRAPISISSTCQPRFVRPSLRTWTISLIGAGFSVAMSRSCGSRSTRP
ncbi:hypothetical protein JHN46_15840 [Streptomyces sp. MBT33]|nr:hypothetical protein [Streptomyces sp. MBT33]